MKRLASTTIAIGLIATLASAAAAQSLEQRIEHVRQQRQQRAIAAQANQQDGQRGTRMTVPQKMGRVLEEVSFDDIPVQEAFQRWSELTDIPLLINWTQMEREGVDPQQPVTMSLQTVPAGQVLRILVHQTAPEVPLVYEVDPWAVQVMTKHQANQHTVVRVYPVGDLTMPVPDFTDAPETDLEASLERAEDRSDRSFFGDSDDDDDDDEDSDDEGPTREENEQRLADLIRNTIEPNIWRTNNPEGNSSIRYYNDKLIVRAPMYVQRQIGMPSMSMQPARRAAPAPGQPATAPRAIEMERRDWAPSMDRFYSQSRHTDRAGIGPRSTPPAGVAE